MPRLPRSPRLEDDPLGPTIAAAARGDRRAFKRLYDAHVQAVYARVARLVGPGAAADDATQDVFIAVFEALPGFRGDACFSTWLYRVTRNVAITHLRRRGGEAVDLAAYRLLATPDTTPDIEGRRQLAALDAALRDMGFEAREAFVLFELEGRSLAEIAELTEAPLHTVASRIRRTRERLRAVLERAAPVRQSGAG